MRQERKVIIRCRVCTYMKGYLNKNVCSVCVCARARGVCGVCGSEGREVAILLFTDVDWERMKTKKKVKRRGGGFLFGWLR